MEAEIKETTDLKRDCTSCKSFYSYADKYEDELEPFEFGTCDKRIDGEMVGEEMICDLFESKYI